MKSSHLQNSRGVLKTVITLDCMIATSKETPQYRSLKFVSYLEKGVFEEAANLQIFERMELDKTGHKPKVTCPYKKRRGQKMRPRPQ